MARFVLGPPDGRLIDDPHPIVIRADNMQQALVELLETYGSYRKNFRTECSVRIQVFRPNGRLQVERTVYPAEDLPRCTRCEMPFLDEPGVTTCRGCRRWAESMRRARQRVDLIGDFDNRIDPERCPATIDGLPGVLPTDVMLRCGLVANHKLDHEFRVQWDSAGPARRVRLSWSDA